MDKLPDVTEVLADICRWPYQIDPDDQLVTVVLRGDPTPSPRPRLGRGGNVYMGKAYTSYREQLAWTMKGKIGSIGVRDGIFGMRAIFFRRTRQRTDVDNLLKTCHDAGTGVIWKDDSQVVETFGRIFFESDDPRVVLLIYQPAAGPLPSPLTCERCGKSFQVRWPSARKTRRFCSTTCKFERIEKACDKCGSTFTVPKSLSKRPLARFCSKECSLRFYAEKRRMNYSPKLCEDCGKRVSRPEYQRCKACSMKQRNRTTQYDMFKPA